MSVQCVVIIGTTPTLREQKKSFDLFRDAVKNVVVLTFDELLERIRELRQLMGNRAGQSTSETHVASTPSFGPEDDDNSDLF